MKRITLILMVLVVALCMSSVVTGEDGEKWGFAVKRPSVFQLSSSDNYDWDLRVYNSEAVFKSELAAMSPSAEIRAYRLREIEIEKIDTKQWQVKEPTVVSIIQYGCLESRVFELGDIVGPVTVSFTELEPESKTYWFRNRIKADFHSKVLDVNGVQAAYVNGHRLIIYKADCCFTWAEIEKDLKKIKGWNPCSK